MPRRKNEGLPVDAEYEDDIPKAGEPLSYGKTVTP
jgi:hypothetical protein